MVRRIFDSFGGREIVTFEYGARHDPTVVIFPDQASALQTWEAASEALAEAGRHVMLLDPVNAAEDGRTRVEDCKSLLRALSSRPVVIGAGQGGIDAILALGEGEPDPASGLILIDRGIEQAETADAARLDKAAARLRFPAMLITDNLNTALSQAASSIEGLEALEPTNETADTIIAGEEFEALLVEFLERRVPRTPPEYLSGSDPRTLRDALGTFATGVTVLTARGADGEPVGLTANSFTSVSLDPPLLLVCPARSSGSMEALHQASHFAVNVLHIGQQAISNLFATKGEDRFSKTEFETWEHDVPILTNSLASFECRKHAEHDGGDHVILVGEVLRVRFAPQRDPLLYFRGKYRRLHFA